MCEIDGIAGARSLTTSEKADVSSFSNIKERKNKKMINLSNFEILEECEIWKMKGGRVRFKEYWIAIRDGNIGVHILKSRLLNQRRSQRSPAHPKGYEALRTLYGERRFDLDRSDFRVPELGIAPAWLRGEPKVTVHFPRRPACILRTPRDPYRVGILEDEYRRFGLGYAVRKAIEREPNNLPIVADLLGLSANRGKLINDSEAVALLETQLLRADMCTIEDLVGLLKTPDSTCRSSPVGLAAAA
jgi:hypothetical protein